MIDNDIRSSIRAKIRPFPRVATYPTGWAGPLTFEQIAEELRPRAAKMLLKQYRVWPQDLDDCLQNGLMYVWEQLAAERKFLAQSSRLEAALIVCHRSKSTSIRKQNLRYEYLEDFWAKHDFKHPDELAVNGLERFKIGGERWATWATLVDIRIDIERAVLAVYEPVKDDFLGLLALYAATTGVTCKDLAYVVPGKGEEAVRCRAVAIRDELRGLLGALAGNTKRWREKFDAGEVVPAMQLLVRHEQNVMMVKAIHSLLDGQSLRRSASALGCNVNTFQNYRKRANRQLAAVYGCTS